ncbi:hypothetical protein ACFQ4Q_01175 [Lysobacter gummosus]|uniref:hypothetical protein n=1 Tax=Lysobacter gummosus TaxID=262324 RepID=UPI003634EE06
MAVTLVTYQIGRELYLFKTPIDALKNLCHACHQNTARWWEVALGTFNAEVRERNQVNGISAQLQYQLCHFLRNKLGDGCDFFSCTRDPPIGCQSWMVPIWTSADYLQLYRCLADAFQNQKGNRFRRRA